MGNMKILNGNVKNKCRLEGCNIESYNVEEAIEICTRFF